MVATILNGAADSNFGEFFYIPEASWGTTPVSGVVKRMRITSSSLEGKKGTKTSDELRADRMVSDIPETSAMTDGDINWEASAGGQDDFWEHFLLSSWSRAMNFFLVKGDTVSVTDTDEVTISGADWTDWLVVDQFVKLEGFMQAVNNGYFKIEAVSFTGGDTVITTVETSLVAEDGTEYSKIMDASDVILKSTSTAIASGNTINGGGANSFAGQTLRAGQKLYIEGLGKEAGALAVAAPLPTANQSFRISDGVDTVIFEFAASAALATPGRVFLQIVSDPNSIADALRTAVMDQFRRQNFRVSAAKVAGVKEAGSIVFSAVADNGDTVTIDDGRSGAVVFTFAASGNGATGAAVNVATGADENASATNLYNAINANLLLSVTAANGTPGTVNLVNDLYDGGAITKSDGDNDYAVTDFTGGTAPSVALVNHRLSGGAITESLACLTTSAFSGGDATKGGVRTIASLPDDDTIVVSETLTTDANGSSKTVVIKGSHIRNPGDPADITKKSVSGETRFTDVQKFLGHDGLRLAGFKRSVSPGDITKGSFSYMGRVTQPLEETVLGDVGSYTILDTTVTEPLNGTSNVGEVLRNGEALPTALLKIDISGDANLRSQPGVGAKFPVGVGYGQLSVKGSLTAYFITFDFYRDFYLHRNVALEWYEEDADHNRYYFSLPSVKLLSDPLGIEGLNKDVTEEIQWQAKRHPSLKTMMMMDRFSSVWPASVA